MDVIVAIIEIKALQLSQTAYCLGQCLQAVVENVEKREGTQLLDVVRERLHIVGIELEMPETGKLAYAARQRPKPVDPQV